MARSCAQSSRSPPDRNHLAIDPTSCLQGNLISPHCPTIYTCQSNIPGTTEGVVRVPFTPTISSGYILWSPRSLLAVAGQGKVMVSLAPLNVIHCSYNRFVVSGGPPPGVYDLALRMVSVTGIRPDRFTPRCPEWPLGSAIEFHDWPRCSCLASVVKG